MKLEDGLPDNPLDEPAEARVARGARLLDEYWGPGWRDRIDRDRLDMIHEDDCVLGQLFNGYWAGLRHVGIVNHVQASRYGFQACVDYAIDVEALAALKPVWLAELDRATTP
jgi:hypothetical protein